MVLNNFLWLLLNDFLLLCDSHNYILLPFKEHFFYFGIYHVFLDPHDLSLLLALKCGRDQISNIILFSLVSVIVLQTYQALPSFCLDHIPSSASPNLRSSLNGAIFNQLAFKIKIYVSFSRMTWQGYKFCLTILLAWGPSQEESVGGSFQSKEKQSLSRGTWVHEPALSKCL